MTRRPVRSSLLCLSLVVPALVAGCGDNDTVTADPLDGSVFDAKSEADVSSDRQPDVQVEAGVEPEAEAGPVCPTATFVAPADGAKLQGMPADGDAGDGGSSSCSSGYLTDIE